MYPQLYDFYWNYLVLELLNPKLLFTSKDSKNNFEDKKITTIIDKKENEKLQQFLGKKFER